MSIEGAPAFNPDKPFTEVHAHKKYRFKQNGYYYDPQGNPVAEEPKPPKVRMGVKKLRKGEGKQVRPDLGLDELHVGSLPDAVAETRQENARARAAEDLLG